MSRTVFYAWQSDLPNNTNRGFIRDALDRAIKAINADIPVEDALRPDQDTKDIPGSPTVADVIFEKIDACSVFVPDVSIITPKNAKRPSPNPNVLIEYGRATKTLGDDYILPVFNTAFGDWEKDRPFDMRHKRKPLCYNLPSTHTPEVRRKARDQLVAQFRQAIQTILDHGLPTQTQQLPPRESFDQCQSYYFDVKPKERPSGRIIGFWCGLIPIADGISLPRPFQHKDIFERQPSINGTFPNSHSPLGLQTMDRIGDGCCQATNVMPGLRYGQRIWNRRIWSKEAPTGDEDICAIRVDENGVLTVVTRTNHLEPAPSLYVNWIMADIANALRAMDTLRASINRKDAEYALMLELRYDECTSTIPMPVPFGKWRLGLLADEEPNGYSKLMSSAPQYFGPYRVEGSETFSRVMSEVLADIYMAAGRHPEDEFSFIWE